MTKRFRPLHELTLFAGEEDLAMAVLGPGQLRHWKQVVQLLEERGFPRSEPSKPSSTGNTGYGTGTGFGAAFAGEVGGVTRSER